MPSLLLREKEPSSSGLDVAVESTFSREGKAGDSSYGGAGELGGPACESRWVASASRGYGMCCRKALALEKGRLTRIYGGAIGGEAELSRASR